MQTYGSPSIVRPVLNVGFMDFFLGLAVAGLVFALAGRSILGSLIGGVLATIWCLLALPTYRLDFAEPWFIVWCCFCVGAAISVFKHGEPTRSAVGFAVGFPVLFILAYVCTTSEMLNAQRYGQIIGDVPTVSFAKAMMRLDTTGSGSASGTTVLDQKNVRLVDITLATRSAEQLLGSDPALGGTYALGTMSLTKLDGRFVWAGPLEFNGLFKFLSAGGSPGYVYVDAHDWKDAALVRTADHAPIVMRCLSSSYFSSWMERSLRSQGFYSTGLEDYSFELDNGRPMFVATTYEHKVGFSGDKATGIVAYDPQTCIAKPYDMEHIPAWVNRVIPADMALSQVSYWGDYRLHGWWNASFGAEADVVLPTQGASTGSNDTASGIELVSTNNGGDTAWYMGLSTTGNPNGTTGFILIDSRTGQARTFLQAGASEDAAAAAITSKISNMRGWTTTWPILYNIGGRATYLSTLKDGSGNFGGIGLVPVNDRNTVVTANDLQTGLQLYEQALAQQAGSIGGVLGTAPEMTFTGKVFRVSSQVINGNTNYYLMLLGHPGLVFTATSPNPDGPQVSLTQPGDDVKLKARGDVGSGSLTVVTFSDAATASANSGLPHQQK